MRLSHVMDTIIKANLNYFVRHRYETPETRDRVYAWLEGTDDPEIQGKIINWLESDANWVHDIRRAVAKRTLIFAPFTWLVMWHIEDRFRSWVRKLSKEKEGQLRST